MTLADGYVVDVYDLHAEAGGTETDQALQVDDYEQLAAFIRPIRQVAPWCSPATRTCTPT
ncbi:MAG: hypothetical protein R2714_14045 [Microthrixaceae bacterium]